MIAFYFSRAAAVRDWGSMKEFWIASAVAMAVMIGSYPFMGRAPQPAPQETAADNAAQKPSQNAVAKPAETAVETPAEDATEKAADRAPAEAPQQQTAAISVNEQPVASEQQTAAATNITVEGTYLDSMPLRPDLSYLAYYVYSEVPPDTKPADIVRHALRDIPEGAPVDEVELAASVLGLDVGFMKAVAKIESGFDPKQRTGSYIGLFQLSRYEFDKYGSGDIIDARDNAIAGSYKFITAAVMFEMETHKKPTISDLYLIHQQGTQGAAEHVSHPERIAWKSMCATDEGRAKGEKWCKRAIWQNTLPAIKQIWKSVDNLTSGAFVAMWQQRVDTFYTRYSQALAQ
jgi:hypothetical protein